MPNLMITNSGARGDTIYGIPVLNVLRPLFDEIYMCGQAYCQSVLESTDLVDQFLIKPKEYDLWDADYARQWLVYKTRDLQVDAQTSWRGIVPGRLMFHRHDPKFKMPSVWKRGINKGRNYFDEYTKRTQDDLGIDLSEAIGKRPITKHTHKERSWLRDFRHIYNIPKDAFLLGWQFTGSAKIKWFPFFREVIQMDIMQRYPKVYLIGLGDLAGLLKWDKEYHHGRFVNLTDTISFRQAYILTSIFDLLVSPETGVYCGSQAYPDVPKILLATHTDGTHITCGDETTILTPDCECAPCYNLVHECTKHPEVNAPLCIASIKPETVIRAIEGVIGRKWRIDTIRIQPILTIGEIFGRSHSNV